ncbi:MAG: zinc ribbon domain-containing protein [Chloroflexi bacterium]|nr:zinc ribbon domain-containing protein [Chloroflexota bacterium]
MKNTGQVEPTLSPIANALVHLIEEIINGKDYNELLSKTIDKMTAELEETRANLENQRENADSKTLADFEADISDMESAYADYEEALQHISTYLENYDTEILKEGEEKIIRSVWELTFALQRFNTHYLHSGPSKYPFVNVVAHLSVALKSGSLPKEFLKGFALRARQFFSKAIEEQKLLEEEPGESGRKKMKFAYILFLEAAEIYSRFADSGDPEDLDKGIALFVNAFDFLNKGLTEYNVAKYLENPTTSPYINLLINTFDGIRKGIYPPKILEDNIKIVKENFNKLRRQVEKIDSLSTSSSVITEEIPTLTDALGLLELGIKEAEEYLNDKETERLDNAQKSLIEAAEELDRLQSIFKRVEDTEGKITCIKCGHTNPRNLRFCESCGATMPRFDEDYESYTMQVSETPDAQIEEIPLTSNIARILNASDNFASGRIGVEEFEQVLDWMEALMEECKRNLESLPEVETDNLDEQAEALNDPSELLDESDIVFCEALKEAADNMKNIVDTGLNKILDGVALLRQFITDRSGETLNMAKDHITFGAKTLYAAQIFEPITQEVRIIEHTKEKHPDTGEDSDEPENGAAD